MKPSNFISYPWNSILQNAESEIIARNIMMILVRTGDKFRSLSWKEYKIERLKDKKFSEKEKHYFNKVINYCKTSETARLFCKDWNKIFMELETK